MRRRDKILIGLIAAWQGIIALGWLIFWVFRVKETGFSELTHIYTYPMNFFLADISKIWGLVLVPVSVSACVGLLLKRRWGRLLSITTMVIMALIFSGLIIAFHKPGNMVVEVSMDLLVLSIILLPVFYFTRLRVRELFADSNKAHSRHFFRDLILALGIAVFLLLGSGVYHYASIEIFESKYQAELTRNIEKSRTDLEKYQALWEGKIKGDYSFKLSVYSGGSVFIDREGMTADSRKGSWLAAVPINVLNNQPTPVFGKEPSRLYPTALEHADTIPELFDIIRRLNKGATGSDVLEITGVPQNEIFNIDLSLACITQVEFNSSYGYPTKITIYQRQGVGPTYKKYYLVRYEINRFDH